jgi:hypothetical protein
MRNLKKKNKETTTITLNLPNGQTESLDLDACLFGGIMGDGTGFPCGGYHGSLDLNNTHVSMVHIMRAFIKICEEQGMSSQQAEASLDFCTKEALVREQNNNPLDNVDLETHMIKIRRDHLN